MNEEIIFNTLFPNPANEQVKLVFNSEQERVVSIKNYSGQLLKTYKTKEVENISVLDGTFLKSSILRIISIEPQN